MQLACLLLLALGYGHVCAALPADSTTVRHKKPSTQNDTWFYGFEPEKHYVIDTSIYKMQYYSLAQRDAPEYLNLGNTGTAAYPLLFTPAHTTGFDAGYNQFDLYRFKKDSVKYYQVMRPYAELTMVLGLKNEQIYNGRFANQHKNRIYYGVEFRRIFSKGAYTNQRANDNGFYLYGIYNNKTMRWRLQADLLFNNNKIQENGGVKTNIFNRDTSYFTKDLVPVFLRQAENTYKEIDFYLKAGYNIGKTYLKHESANDTLGQKTVLPLMRVNYQFNVGSNKYYFHDLNPDAAYYDGYLATTDSAYNDFRYLKIGNEASIEYLGRKYDSDTSFRALNFAAIATAGYAHFFLQENKLKDNFGSFYVSAMFRNNPDADSKFLYKASGTYIFSGYNRNDFNVFGSLGYDFRKRGAIQADVTFERKELPFIYNSYQSHALGWSNTFPKTNALSLGLRYNLNVWKLNITLSGNDYIINNYPYFAAINQPAFEANAINGFVTGVSERFAVKGLHIDNDIWFQRVINTTHLRFPQLVTKHSIYYEARLFRKALWLATGFDLRYNSPFYANGYFPLTGQFYLQDNLQLKFYPVLDFFLNFKVKTVRIFLKLDNISSFFGKQAGYYTAYYYPAADFSFKGGVTWRFFE